MKILIVVDDYGHIEFRNKLSEALKAMEPHVKDVVVVGDQSHLPLSALYARPTKEEIELLIDNLPQYDTPIHERPFNEIKSQKDYRRKADKRNFNHYRY